MFFTYLSAIFYLLLNFLPHAQAATFKDIKDVPQKLILQFLDVKDMAKLAQVNLEYAEEVALDRSFSRSRELFETLESLDRTLDEFDQGIGIDEENEEFDRLIEIDEHFHQTECTWNRSELKAHRSIRFRLAKILRKSFQISKRATEYAENVDPLFEEEGQFLREIIVRNPFCPVELINQIIDYSLEKETDFKVLLVATANPLTSGETIFRINRQFLTYPYSGGREKYFKFLEYLLSNRRFNWNEYISLWLKNKKILNRSDYASFVAHLIGFSKNPTLMRTYGEQLFSLTNQIEDKEKFNLCIKNLANSAMKVRMVSFWEKIMGNALEEYRSSYFPNHHSNPCLLLELISESFQGIHFLNSSKMSDLMSSLNEYQQNALFKNLIPQIRDLNLDFEKYSTDPYIFIHDVKSKLIYKIVKNVKNWKNLEWKNKILNQIFNQTESVSELLNSNTINVLIKILPELENTSIKYGIILKILESAKIDKRQAQELWNLAKLTHSEKSPSELLWSMAKNPYLMEEEFLWCVKRAKRIDQRIDLNLSDSLFCAE